MRRERWKAVALTCAGTLMLALGGLLATLAVTWSRTGGQAEDIERKNAAAHECDDTDCQWCRHRAPQDGSPVIWDLEFGRDQEDLAVREIPADSPLYRPRPSEEAPAEAP